MAYGLRAVDGAIGGSGYRHMGPTEYPIADGDTVSIYNGDFVNRLATGYVARPNDATGEQPIAANPVLGVAGGCRYTDVNGTVHWSNHYPGGAGNTNAFIMVHEDPDQVFMIESDGDTTFADVGDNAEIATFGAGSDLTGLSAITLDHSGIAQTSTFALRVVGVPEDGTNELLTSAKNVLVRIMPGVHQNVLADQIP